MTKINNAKAIEFCNSIADEFDTVGGSLEIYDNTQPASVDDAAGATPILTISLPASTFLAAADTSPGASASADGANLPFTAIASVSGGGSTNLTWFRAKNSGGTPIIDGSITATGGGGDLELDAVNISDGQQLNINSWALNMPEFLP